MPGSSLAVQLVTSCNSHLTVGVCEIPKHTQCSVSLIAGLATWSAKQHRTQTSRFKNCRETLVTSSMSELKALPEHCFVHLDIGESFMSGEPEVLALDAAGLSMEGPRQRQNQDVGRFLLENSSSPQKDIETDSRGSRKAQAWA